MTVQKAAAKASRHALIAETKREASLMGYTMQEWDQCHWSLHDGNGVIMHVGSLASCIRFLGYEAKADREHYYSQSGW